MSKPRGVSYCGISSDETCLRAERQSGMRGGLSLPKRRLSGTWEPETPMPTEKPQVEEPRGREYGCGVSGSDCPIVVKKRGNARGAKGAGHSRPNQFRSTGNRRSRAVRTEGSNLQWVARAVCLETVKH